MMWRWCGDDVEMVWCGAVLVERWCAGGVHVQDQLLKVELGYSVSHRAKHAVPVIGEHDITL